MASLPCAALLFTVICSFFLEIVQGQNRMYGGYDVTVNQYPFVVAIAYGPDLIGNGAILGEYWVVSAASTFLQTPDEHYVVRAGGNSFAEGEKYQQERIYRHPEFTGWDNNVALVKTARKMKLGSTVRPINIASGNPGDAMMLSYGDNEDGNHNLRASRFVLVTDPTCANEFNEPQAQDVIRQGHGYCMYSRPNTAQGHAYNDAGGPVFVNYELYGVFAGSETADKVSKISITTRLSAYEQWIQNTMR